MAKHKPVHVGTIKADPRDLTKNQGHDYGKGRKGAAHADKRVKRNKTRQAQKRNAMEGG